MTTARVAIPEKLIPVFDGPADVRGAYGGRGSGKTMTFAKMTAVRALMFAAMGISGIVLCGRQYMNSLADSSLAEIKAAIESEPWLRASFDVGEKYVRTRDGRVSYEFSGLDRSIEAIKSKARILILWVDEAEPVTEDAWKIVIPTLRAEGGEWNAELWVTWNPKRKGSATDKRFRGAQDPLTKVQEINWRDNPCFPQKLERQRKKDQAERPDSYDHIWEGGYETIVEGAYYASGLTLAKQQGRIGFVPFDPLMTIRLFADIGGTGARADAFTLWAMQFIGLEMRVGDYYEAVGQPLATHLAWMRKRSYTPDRAQIWLPHDGATQDRVYDVSYESALKDAGYEVTVVPNQGKGAAKSRIEAGRRLLPSCRFHSPEGGPDSSDIDGPPTCAAGLSALGWYHERRDAERGIGLGPEHDWSSHGADGFGLACVVFEPTTAVNAREPDRMAFEGSWMA